MASAMRDMLDSLHSCDTLDTSDSAMRDTLDLAMGSLVFAMKALVSWDTMYSFDSPVLAARARTKSSTDSVRPQKSTLRASSTVVFVTLGGGQRSPLLAAMPRFRRRDCHHRHCLRQRASPSGCLRATWRCHCCPLFRWPHGSHPCARSKGFREYPGRQAAISHCGCEMARPVQRSGRRAPASTRCPLRTAAHPR